MNNPLPEKLVESNNKEIKAVKTVFCQDTELKQNQKMGQIKEKPINVRYKYVEDDSQNDIIQENEQWNEFLQEEQKNDQASDILKTNGLLAKRGEGNGYSNIHRKKNEEVPRNVDKKEEKMEEKSDINGKIKVINKENLQKLLLD